MGVLAHAGAEGDPCLSNVSSLWAAAAGEFIDAFLVDGVGTCFVRSA